jgi:ABC-type nitrate/sulfonate/bicarbonate transport system substrate-binding protein
VKIKKRSPIDAAAEEQRELTTLRIAGVPEHFNLPWMLALERRAFVRAKVELKWHTVPEGTGRMCEMLRKGEVDLAVMVTEGAVRDILNGNPSKILASYVDSPLTWGVHVGAATGIRSADQLANVPYAISRRNSGSDLVAKAYAKAHGRTLIEEDIVVVNDLKGAEEKLKGTARIAFLWEKFTTKHLVDSGEFRLVDEWSNPWPSFVLVASDAILAEHADKVRSVLKVIRDQAAGLMQKKTAPELFAQRYKMPLEDAREWYRGVQWNTGTPLPMEVLWKVVTALHVAGSLETLPVSEAALNGLLPGPAQKPSQNGVR